MQHLQQMELKREKIDKCAIQLLVEEAQTRETEAVKGVRVST